jgi:transforming growth factor-beta-induced protein
MSKKAALALLVAGALTIGITARASSKDIVDTAVQAGSFKTLAAALQAADLVDTLKGKGPFTVFAPTDEAFAKLPAGTVEELLKPENREQLQRILTYHVVPGRVGSGEVVKLSSATTASGDKLRVSTRNGSVYVDEARVIKTDIEASNGIIHVIDSVVIPASK